MKSNRLHCRKPVQGILAALLLGAVGSACASTSLPPVHTEGNVSYLSGGVGHDEAMAIKAAATHYPLMVEFVGPKVNGHQEYLASDRVIISDHSGKKVLDTVSDGPFLLARLPAGRYKIVATNDGNPEKRMVTIKPNMEKQVIFEWKQSI